MTVKGDIEKQIDATISRQAIDQDMLHAISVALVRNSNARMPLPVARARGASWLRRAWLKMWRKPIVEYCPHCHDVLEASRDAHISRYGMRSFSMCIGQFSWASSWEENPSEGRTKLSCMHLMVGWS